MCSLEIKPWEEVEYFQRYTGTLKSLETQNVGSFSRCAHIGVAEMAFSLLPVSVFIHPGL
jgi:hypothetical protein